MRKKADMSLSINAIVILILAITMLGLGLAFMRNIFGKATGEFQEVSGTVQKQMIDQMKESDKVVDLSGAVYTIKSGEKRIAYIGFKNEGNQEKKFIIRGIKVTSLSGISENCGLYDNNNVILEYKHKTTTVQPGATTVLPINIKARSNAAKDSCFYELLIEEADSNLVGYWNFNVKDDASDLSGNDNNGVIQGATWTKVIDKPELGGAYNFQSNSDVLTLSKNISMNGDWTICTWTKFPLSSAGWRTLTRGLEDHHVIVDGNGNLGMYDNGGSGWQICNPLIDTDNYNGWKHLCAVGSGTQTLFYIDGQWICTSPTKGDKTLIYIGNFYTYSQPWGSLLDDFFIFDRALSDSEIQKIYLGYDYSIQLTVNVEQ